MPKARDLSKIDSVLLDIEGTICSIDFVKETLFPYALNALPTVAKEKWNDPDFTQLRDAFPEDARASPEALSAHVKDLTQRDVKVAYLKNLQGYLWQTGYTSHAYSTPLYPDILPALTRWHARGIAISIYSSGSVFAQKLLFQHIQDTSTSSSSSPDPTATLDKRDLVTHWFDTTNAGPKTEKASYETIANKLGKGREPGSVFFLSDNVAEVGAAEEAHMVGVVVDRPGNARLSKGDRERFEVITSFEGLGS